MNTLVKSRDLSRDNIEYNISQVNLEEFAEVCVLLSSVMETSGAHWEAYSNFNYFHKRKAFYV